MELYCHFSLGFRSRLEGLAFGASFWYIKYMLGLEENSVAFWNLECSLNTRESMLHQYFDTSLAPKSKQA